MLGLNEPHSFDANKFTRRQRKLSAIGATPQMQATGMVIHVLRVWRVELNYRVLWLKEQVFHLAHEFPAWRSCPLIEERNADVLPAFTVTGDDVDSIAVHP
jgi:hypothetical protein